MTTEQEFLICNHSVSNVIDIFGLDGLDRPASPGHPVAVSQLEMCPFQKEIPEEPSESSIFSASMRSTGACIKISHQTWNIHSPQPSRSHPIKSGNKETSHHLYETGEELWGRAPLHLSFPGPAA